MIDIIHYCVDTHTLCISAFFAINHEIQGRYNNVYRDVALREINAKQ